MEPLTDIIQRCYHRHQKPLRQQKTVATPAMLGRGYLHQYTVYCAHKYPVLLDDLEQAEISFMPIGRAPKHDSGPKHFRDKKFLKRQRMQDWAIRRWDTSWGILIYTGMPSERNGARWHDLHFKYEALCTAPDAVFACIEALVNAVSNPLLTMTRSGGLRFSCRVPDYLHPEGEEERLYIYRHTPTAENPQHRDVYLEIFGEKRYSCWDARYEILFGDLLNPPVIAKEVLFAPIDALRAKLHEPVPQDIKQNAFITTAPSSLGSRDLDLAKKALLKRGFSYVRQENGIHHWIQYGGEVNNTDILLWESDGTVWLRTATPDTGFPVEATPMAEVWADTGIVSPTLAVTLPISDKVPAVREGKLSPLAIRRSSPVLHKSELEKDPVQIQRILEGTARILGLTVETNEIDNYEIESHFLNSHAICLSVPTAEAAEAAAQYLQEQNVPSVARWKSRMHLWDQVKDIPIDVRMATPFEHGNVCEDAERCEVLEEKGGDPSENICSQCPVYKACQVRGYLSQSTAFQRAKAQILTIPQLLFNPRYTELAEDILREKNGMEERVYIINNLQQVDDLFLRCRISKNILEEWSVNWEGHALGNFAKTLLNALEVRGKSHSDSVKRVRTVTQAFEWQEAEIVRQMCQVNVQGKIVSMTQAIQLGILDTKTAKRIKTFPTVCSNPNWTFWHQMKHLFACYTRDADVPIRWDHEVLRFWIPPVLHPSVKRLVLTSTVLSERHLRRAFPDDEVEVNRPESTPWVAGNQVFQIRTGLYPREEILDHNSDWGVVNVSKIGQHFLAGIRAEIEREPSIKHVIFTNRVSTRKLANRLEKSSNFSIIGPAEMTEIDPAIGAADVIWIVGTPPENQGIIWQRAQNLFGNDEEPLCYDRETKPFHYKDERVQSVYEAAIVSLLTQIVGQTQLNRLSGKKVVLMTSMQLPDITDRPDTLFFDWEDFEIAGGLDKLAETIATRQHFETEKANLTAESGRDKVQHVLGCSIVHANRVLRDLRGGNLRSATFREQILSLLADGEKKSSEVVAAIDGNPKAINHELVRLNKIGEIVKVRWGVYALPKK